MQSVEIQIYINFEVLSEAMELKLALKKLRESDNFRKWEQKNKGTYFSYAFKIPQEMDDGEWQLGFYDRKKDRITTFVTKDDSISIRPEEEVFNEEKTQVDEVELSKVRLSFDDAMAKSSEFQQKNFPKDKSMKTIAILQNLPNLGNV